MELNSVLFPSPEFKGDPISEHHGVLIFIKSKSPEINSSKAIESYIPCLFLLAITKRISRNFLIYFHGNAEDIFGARDMGEKLRLNLNMNVLIVEYPGYSIYKEEKCSDRILEDCITAYDFLTESFGVHDEDIFVFGRSIGTSPAIFLSSKRKPTALFLMSPFTSIRAAAESLFGNILKYFISER